MRATLRLCARNKYRAASVPHFQDPNYPITETLTGVFGGYESEESEFLLERAGSQDRVPGKRVEVVSEQLCGNSTSYRH